MDLLSRLDLFNVGANFLNQRAIKIDPNQVFILGSDANLFVGATSVVADTINSQLLYAIASLLLDSATGEDLDRYAWDRYRLTRKDANAAVVDVTISRPNANNGPG